jgi:hypothetical protein
MDRYNFYYRQNVQPSEINAAFDTIEEEFAEVAKSYGSGIAQGGTVSPESPVSNILHVTSLTGYDEDGVRMRMPATDVDTNTDENSVPISFSSGEDIWVSVFVKWETTLSDTRTDGYGVAIDYHETITPSLVVVFGTPATSGTATRPALRNNQLLVADVLFTHPDTDVTENNIYTDRTQTLINVNTVFGQVQRRTAENAIDQLATLTNDALTAAYKAADDIVLLRERHNVLRNRKALIPDGGYGNNFHTLSYSDTTYAFVAAGNAAEIQYSTDAITWSHKTADNSYTGDFQGGCWSQDLAKYVLVGTTGEIQTSLDGLTWAHQTPDSGYTGTFRSITPGFLRVVAVGDNGEIQSSANGTSWTHRVADGGYTGSFYGVTWSETLSLFVAVGTNGEIQTSPDRITWTSRTSASGTTDNYSVCFGKGVFVIVGEDGMIQTSPDGITWTLRQPPNQTTLYEVAFVADHFIAVGNNGQVVTSTDGISWYSVRDTNFTLGLRAIAYGETTYVASFGTSVTNRENYVLAGVSGTLQQASLGTLRHDIKTVEDQILDTIESAELTRPSTLGAANTYSLEEAIDKKISGLLLSSWSAVTPAGGYATAIKDIVFSKVLGLFIFVGASGIQTSPDGDTWTSRSAVSSLVRIAIDEDVTTGAFKAVAVGSSGAIYTSSDAITWTARTAGSGYSAEFYSVAWSPDLGLFVAVGDSAEIQTSPNGNTWTRRHTGGSTLKDVVWYTKAGKFVAVGDNISSTPCQESSDGITWSDMSDTGINAAPFDAVKRVTADAEYIYIAVAGGGAIFRSDSAISTWTQIKSSAGADPYLFRVVNGRIFMSDSGSNFFVCSDQTNWIERTENVLSPYGGIAFGRAYGVSFFIRCGDPLNNVTKLQKSSTY